jgi:hypothetical protein
MPEVDDELEVWPKQPSHGSAGQVVHLHENRDASTCINHIVNSLIDKEAEVFTCR